jgi:diguanylate cyclase
MRQPPDGRVLSRSATRLTWAIIVGGLLAAGVGLALPTASSDTSYLQLALAAGVMATAQLARLRFRLASGTINITWGEAALVICLHLAPAGWLPAAALLGAGLAWLLLMLLEGQRTVVEALGNAASVTVAAALAAAVTGSLVDPVGTALTPAVAVALVLGAAAYLLTCALLAALTLRARYGLPIAASIRNTLRGKLPMFGGNVTVGLVAVALLHHDIRWLLILVPVLWLLQQAYRQWLRVDCERKLWLDYAAAVKALNRLDEGAVAAAGVAGALRVFGAHEVDLDMVRDGGVRRYHGDSSGRIDSEDFEEGTPEPAHEVIRQPLIAGAEQLGELRLRLPRWVSLGAREVAVLSAYADALAVALHSAATYQARLAAAADAQHAATRDPLTQLLNRTALFVEGERALRRASRGQPVVLMVLDVDNFAEINETLGYAAGDELLKLVADRLRTVARPGELLGRIGDDEFALLSTTLPVRAPRVPQQRPALTPNALRRARQIAELLANPGEVAEVRVSAEVAVGAVVAQAGTVEMAELLRRAQIALHQAKEEGGVATYDNARDATDTDHLTLLAELREALAADDQLVLALQPAVDLITGAPTGVEALVRWHHPRRGKLNPAEFVHAVEDSELLAPFTRYVIDKALAVAAEWTRHGLTVPISVNVSARSLLDPRLPAEIADLLRRHKVPPQRLVLEITETVEMAELDVIDDVLASLQALGVQLAVDDFGTGFSSFAFLARVPVNELKVDRSFVMRMAESAEAAAIVRATVALGRELGLRVIAEGVETAEQRRVLAALGCEAAQGYHFFKPMPSDKVVPVLRSLLDSAQARILSLQAESTS